MYTTPLTAIRWILRTIGTVLVQLGNGGHADRGSNPGHHSGELDSVDIKEELWRLTHRIDERLSDMHNLLIQIATQMNERKP